MTHSEPPPAGSDPVAPDPLPAASTDAEPTPDPAPEAVADDAPVAAATPPAPRGRPFISGLQLAVAVVAIMAGAALFLSGYSLGRQNATTPGTPGNEQAAFVPFWDAYRAVTEQYAGGQVDQKQVIEGAIRGMIEALGDPFSQYLSSEDFKKSLQGIAGQFEGVGANIDGRKSDGSGASCATLAPDCLMTVISPVDGGPADKAGLKAADVITAIDGTSVNGMALSDAVGKVRGPKGTTVVLTVVRHGGQPFPISIVRDVIAEKEIVTRSLANDTVGYIKLTGFSDNSSADFTHALSDDIRAGQKKIILDLRGNPGGFVTAARSVASQFIKSGPVYWQQDAAGNQVATMATGDGVATDPGIQLVVLIDKGSASASEIVAGALQDTKRAQLVGQTSYGKGTIQEWEPLPNDTGGFRLTIARWLTPDKRWIHKVGLTPDVAVDVPQSTPPDQDPVLDRALQLLGAPPSAAGLQVAA